jgi:hypothetical protein
MSFEEKAQCYQTVCSGVYNDCPKAQTCPHGKVKYRRKLTSKDLECPIKFRHKESEYNEKPVPARWQIAAAYNFHQVCKFKMLHPSEFNLKEWDERTRQDIKKPKVKLYGVFRRHRLSRLLEGWVEHSFSLGFSKGHVRVQNLQMCEQDLKSCVKRAKKDGDSKLYDYFIVRLTGDNTVAQVDWNADKRRKFAWRNFPFKERMRDTQESKVDHI